MVPVKERLLGSVSHRILTLAPCATLIVNGPVKAMKQILLPLQGPSNAEAAIRFLQLNPFHDAIEVTLLTILLRQSRHGRAKQPPPRN